MPQGIGTEVVQARRGRGRSEDPLAPVSPVFVVPGGAVEPREDRRFFVRTSALQAPLSKIARERSEESPGPRLSRLRLLDLSKRRRTLNEDRPRVPWATRASTDFDLHRRAPRRIHARRPAAATLVHDG
jgi:hypothetical protein